MLILFLALSSALDVQEIKIGNPDQQLNLKSGCQVFHLGTNFQRTEIHFFSQAETTVLYSDVLTQTCDTTKCTADSILCGQKKSFKSSEIVIGACISDIYLYVKTSTSNTLTLTSNYLPGDCDKIVEDMYNTCGAMNYKECDKCGDECRLADCVKEEDPNSKERILMNLCLPYNISIEEVDMRCNKYKDVDVGRWKQDCDDSIKIDSIGAGTIIALVVIMMAFFAFVGIVTWYNWKVKSTGAPPFKCHRLCPEVLFPRPRQSSPPQQSSYRPPEISLNTFK